MTADIPQRPCSFKPTPPLLYKRQHERREEVPGLELVALVHDEAICVVRDEHAERALAWLTDIMESAADAIVNGDAPAETRVPIKADTKVCGSWADK